MMVQHSRSLYKLLFLWGDLMKIIKELSNDIENSLDAAEIYAKKALMYKEEYKGIADNYYNLSLECIDQIKGLHSQVVEIINTYRKEHGDPPAGMKVLYDYLHERFIEKEAAVKQLQSLYKE